jgi:hypothetical protein
MGMDGCPMIMSLRQCVHVGMRLINTLKEKRMKIYRFDNVKKRAKEEFDNRFRRGCIHPSEGQFLALFASLSDLTPTKPLELMEEWERYAHNLIENWDIRCSMKLAELFPSCLPAHTKGRKPTCEYDENGNWVLMFD